MNTASGTRESGEGGGLVSVWILTSHQPHRVVSARKGRGEGREGDRQTDRQRDRERQRQRGRQADIFSGTHRGRDEHNIGIGSTFLTHGIPVHYTSK